MNLEKAIEILTRLSSELDIPERTEERDASHLGIEAIERLEDWRAGKVVNPSFMLPSETEE